MKIGFNEGCNRFCEGHSVLEDLDLCEKYGFDYIDIQSECLEREITAGKYTIDDLAAWFADPSHKLRMLFSEGRYSRGNTRTADKIIEHWEARDPVNNVIVEWDEERSC